MNDNDKFPWKTIASVISACVCTFLAGYFVGKEEGELAEMMRHHEQVQKWSKSMEDAIVTVQALRARVDELEDKHDDNAVRLRVKQWEQEALR